MDIPNILLTSSSPPPNGNSKPSPTLKPAIYKKIKFTTDSHSQDQNHNTSKPGVSFDTVGIRYFDEYIESSEDEDEENKNDLPKPLGQKLSRTRSPTPQNLFYQEQRSPSPYGNNRGDRSPSPLGYKRFDGKKIDGLSGIFDENGFRTDYPSTSAIKDQSFTLKSTHPQFTSAQRSILVYISGRRHTWIALDFVVTKMLRDHDKLVVLTTIPECHKFDINKIIDDQNLKNSYSSKAEINSEILKDISQRIRSYIDTLIDLNSNGYQNKIIYEQVIDIFISPSTKEMLEQSIDIHEPHLLVTSANPSLRFLKSYTWHTRRISDRLVRNFSIPVLIVPTNSMNEFEAELFEELKQLHPDWESNILDLKSSLKMFNLQNASIPTLTKLVKQRLDHRQKEKEKKEIVNDNPILKSEVSSIASDTDSESTNTTDEDEKEEEEHDEIRNLTHTISGYMKDMDTFIEKIDEEPIVNNSNEQTFFLNKLNNISDTITKISTKFDEVSEQGGEEGDKLVRSFTGLPILEKQKSMLDVLDPVPDKKAINNLKSHLNNMNGNTNSKSIKFAKETSTPEKLKFKSELDLTQLRKSKSNIEEARNHRGDDDDGDTIEGRLQPSRSHQPQLIQTRSESRVNTLEKKKGGFLRNLFKKKDK